MFWPNKLQCIGENEKIKGDAECKHGQLMNLNDVPYENQILLSSVGAQKDLSDERLKRFGISPQHFWRIEKLQKAVFHMITKVVAQAIIHEEPFASWIFAYFLFIVFFLN